MKFDYCFSQNPWHIEFGFTLYHDGVTAGFELDLLWFSVWGSVDVHRFCKECETDE